MDQTIKRSVAAPLALAALLASIGVAGVAHAQETSATLRGQTTEGALVTLRVDAAGTAIRFAVRQADVPCKHGDLGGVAGTYRRFGTSAPGSFAGTLSESSSGDGFTFKSKDAFSGAVAADGTWSGTLKTKIGVLKKGRKIDTCRLNTSWAAS